MGSTKIFVIQMKEVLKSLIYVAIGIVVIVLLAYFFIPKKNNVIEPASAENDVMYTPGTYAIELLLTNTPVNLEVKVSENEIVSIKFTDLEEDQMAFYPLFDPTMKLLSSEILRTESADLVTTSDYEVTNRVLLDAIKIALNTAQVAVADQ